MKRQINKCMTPLLDQELKNHIIEIKSKISYIEKQIQEIEKDYKYGYGEFSKLKDRLESIKYDLAQKKDLDFVEDSLNKLKEKLNIIELELPEFRLVKKLILGMIAFVLTAFLGLVWNTTIIPPTKKTDAIIDDIARKVAEEYKKNEPTK